MVAKRPLRIDPARSGRIRQRLAPRDDVDEHRHVRGRHPTRRHGHVDDVGQRDIGAGIEGIGLGRLGQLPGRIGLADRPHRPRRAHQPLAQIQQHVRRHVPAAVQRVGGEQLPHHPDHLGLEILHRHLAAGRAAAMTSHLGHDPGHQQRQRDPAGITTTAPHRPLDQRPQQSVLRRRVDRRGRHPPRRVRPTRRPRTVPQRQPCPGRQPVIDRQAPPLLIQSGEQLPHRHRSLRSSNRSQRGAPCDGQRTAPGPAGRTAAKKSRSTCRRKRTGARRPGRSTPPGRRPFERPASIVTGRGAGAVESRTGPGQRRFSTVPAPTHRPGPPAPTTGTRTTDTAPSGAVQVGVGEWSRGRHALGPTTNCAVVPVGSTCTPTTATGGRNRTARPTPSLRVGR